MTSFLPLLEAFLALGLTMIVLTTGVSSLTGAWHRAIRSRALGLREMLCSLFMLGLKHRLPKAAEGVPQNGGQTGNGNEPLCRFLGEMSLQSAPLAEMVLLDSTSQNTEYKKKFQRLNREPSSDGSKQDKNSMLDKVSRSWNVWSSLGETLDTLSEEEFKTRFRESTIGKAIQLADADGFGATVDSLYEQFVAYGHAETEKFSRNARRDSMVFAAILAIGANIDAFNLLETYLAQPALRSAIVEKYENEGGQVKSEEFQSRTSAEGTTADTSLVKKVDQVVELATSFAPERQEQIDAKAEEAKDAIRATEKAYAETRQVVSHATMTFPVGWDRYPGCYAVSPDARCVRLMTKLSYSATSIEEKSDGIVNRLGFALKNDTSQALRWLFGVILTILMLGLGTPFWIQTVNGLLRARDLVRGGNQPGDGSKPQSGQTG